jgi:hypothetical protein
MEDYGDDYKDAEEDELDKKTDDDDNLTLIALGCTVGTC